MRLRSTAAVMLTAFTLGVQSLSPCHAGEPQGVAQPPAPGPPDATAQPNKLKLPETLLAPIAGYADDSAVESASTHKANEFAGKASLTSDTGQSIAWFLAAANEILAHRIEPACTYRLLGVAPGPNELAAALDRADKHIADAQTAFDRDAEPEPLPEADRSTHERIETLGAFSEGLRAFLLDEPGDDGARAARHAASRLAGLLEDNDPRVAAAAGLWQSTLRVRASGPARGLSVLDSALSEPSRQALPYAFFARLLRCRLLAQQGSFASALALLIQIEDRCDTWLAKKGDRANAFRATTLVELQVLRDWHQHLSEPKQARERKWCADRFAKLVTERLSEDDRTLYRLTAAIPIIAPPPDGNNAQDR